MLINNYCVGKTVQNNLKFLKNFILFREQQFLQLEQCFQLREVEGENVGDDVPVCRAYRGASCGCLCNLFVSDGRSDGEVLHISVKQRIGDLKLYKLYPLHFTVSGRSGRG